jgi:hypothetical protein
MSQGKKLRTFDDLLRVVRALAYEFKADTVFIVGSQAILASMPDAPEAARESPEIDAFPQNAKIWEVEEAQRTRDGVRPIASAPGDRIRAFLPVPPHLDLPPL